MAFVLLVAVLVLFGIAAQQWGVDSRTYDLDRSDPTLG